MPWHNLVTGYPAVLTKNPVIVGFVFSLASMSLEDHRLMTLTGFAPLLQGTAALHGKL